MAESLHCLFESITMLLIGYTPIQNKKKKIKLLIEHYFPFHVGKDYILRKHKQEGYMLFMGLPRWPNSKEFFCQCRRCSFDPWVRKILGRREWQTTPIFLLGKSQGQMSLVGYSPWDRRRVGNNLATLHMKMLFIWKNIYFRITF